MRQDPETERQRPSVVDRTAVEGRTGGLSALSDLNDYEIADGDPDIRGWDIRSADGQKLGEVDDLLIDAQAMKVRYVEMKIDDALATDDDHRLAVLPIGAARLDEDADTVLVNIRAADLRHLPPYVRGGLTREHERALMVSLAGSSHDTGITPQDDGADFYDQLSFDDRRIFEGRRARTGRGGDADPQYLRRPE
jgi:hypothetical protein